MRWSLGGGEYRYLGGGIGAKLARKSQQRPSRSEHQQAGAKASILPMRIATEPKIRGAAVVDCASMMVDPNRL
jgi:hypothetical protein